MFSPSLPSSLTLFSLQAQRLRKLAELAREEGEGGEGKEVLWYVMVNEKKEEEVREFFEKNDYFGKRGDVKFFLQESQPCYSPDGLYIIGGKWGKRGGGRGGNKKKIRKEEGEGKEDIFLVFSIYFFFFKPPHSLLSSLSSILLNINIKNITIIIGKIHISPNKDKILCAPNGNGGVYRGLVKGGVLEDMRDRGVEYVFAYGVDNLLVRVVDPLFLGCLAMQVFFFFNIILLFY